MLSDLKDLGIYTSASDLSAKRDFLKNQRQRARGFMMAYCEAIWLGKAQQNVALASFRKQMREQDPRRLETLHKNYVVDALPLEALSDGRSHSDGDGKSHHRPWRSFAANRRADFIDKIIAQPISIAKGF